MIEQCRYEEAGRLIAYKGVCEELSVDVAREKLLGLLEHYKKGATK